MLLLYELCLHVHHLEIQSLQLREVHQTTPLISHLRTPLHRITLTMTRTNTIDVAARCGVDTGSCATLPVPLLELLDERDEDLNVEHLRFEVPHTEIALPELHDETQINRL
jgi:hypothetical protein